MNTKYSNLSESLGYLDGLAVLGVFLKVTHVCLFIKPFYSPTVKCSPNVFLVCAC